MSCIQVRLVIPLLVVITAVGCGGGNSSSQTGNSPPPPPPQLKLTAISPSRVTLGIPLNQITLWGQNFWPTSAVYFDGAVGNSVFVSGNEIDLLFPSAVTLTSQIGTHTVQVADLTGRGTSAKFTLTVYQPGPGPQVFNAEPTTFVEGETAPAPYADVLADFNGDGLDDLVFANSVGSTLYILYGQPDGSLSAPTTITFPWGEAYAMAAGDVNGDGHPDLVVVGLDSSGTFATIRIETYLNDGKGNLQPYSSTNYSALDVHAVALADFYGTGHLDVVVGAESANQGVMLFAGQGDGSFSNPVPLGLTNFTCLQIAVADLNGDGLPDIVYEAENNLQVDQVRTLINLGNGQFSDSQPAALAGLTGPFVVADFNNDHKPDIALLNYVNVLTPISIMLGQGDGTFVAGNPVPKTQIGQTISLSVGDLDADGNIDLITSTNLYGPDQAAIFWGDGTGNFSLQLITEETSARPLIGDVNGDGIADLVQPGFTKFVGVTLGRRDRNFALPEYVQPPFQGVLYSVDALGDGFQDLYVDGKFTDLTAYPGTIYHLQPDGSFKAIGSTPPAGILLADLDGDHIADLIGQDQTGMLAIWKGDGSGDFGAGLSGSTPPVYEYQLSGRVPQVEVHDMDGDGIPDIVVNGMIFYGKGGFNFTPVAIPVEQFAIGDFDGDGILDIATPAGIMFGLGNRQYTAPQGSTAAFASNPYGGVWVVGDINGDGKDDIVFASDTWVEIALGTDRGGIYLDQIMDTGDLVSFLGVADFNGDGRLDIVTGTGFAEDAVLFTNDGQGGFLISTSGIGVSADGGAIGDFYHHGKPDLAIQAFPLGYRPQSVILVSHQ